MADERFEDGIRAIFTDMDPLSVGRLTKDPAIFTHMSPDGCLGTRGDVA